MNMNQVQNLKDYQIEMFAKPIQLVLKRSFNTAHSSSIVRTNFLIKVILRDWQLLDSVDKHSNQQQIPEIQKIMLVGYGECGLPPKKPFCYIADIKDCMAFYSDIQNQFALFNTELLAQLTSQVNSKHQKSNYLKQQLSTFFKQTFSDITDLQDQNPKYFGFMKQKVLQLLSYSCQIQQKSKKDTEKSWVLRIYFFLQLLFLLKYGKQLCELKQQYKSGRSALQFSLLDLTGKIYNKSVSQIICDKGSQTINRVNYSFYTISYQQDLQNMLKNGQESLMFTNCIKIKFNSQIQKLLKLLVLMDQKEIGQKWIIDANASWSPADYLKFEQMLNKIASQNQSIKNKLLFIQQPYPIFQSLIQLKGQQQVCVIGKEWKQIKEKTRLIIIADESFCSTDSLQRVMDYSHGINIKMQKCGGPIESVKILKQLQKYKVQHLMFGSMVSTHLGCTQTFQFYQFATYFDIDGALLVRQPQIKGGFQWKSQRGIQKIKGKGLALEDQSVQRLF